MKIHCTYPCYELFSRSIPPSLSPPSLTMDKVRGTADVQHTPSSHRHRLRRPFIKAYARSSFGETQSTSTLAEERPSSLTLQALDYIGERFRSSPTRQEEGGIEDIADLEGMCTTDFGLELEKVRSRMLTQVEAQQSAFRRLCEDLRRTTDPPRRQEIVIDFVNEAAESAKVTTDEALRTCIDVQAFCLSKLQENNKALMEASRASDTEVKQLKEAWEISQLDKQMIADELRLQFQQEKAALEASLREKLVACQLCLKNPRNVVIMPCLHAQFCKECLEANKDRNNNKCPTCRGPVVGMLPYIACI
ncbi:hypothetical protein KP509_30G038900 [Ceratopteris richardii]|uniref:RING-type domain-containing protein n=1 Tax=Ceratopteris richardii TaxID=49495 RepID=A0A8T2R1U3_CERRI|nr:hypothetical protein KP509_30G038900 [Ceratopteris richardii]